VTDKAGTPNDSGKMAPIAASRMEDRQRRGDRGQYRDLLQQDYDY
jgi:hypothetical protein